MLALLLSALTAPVAVDAPLAGLPPTWLTTGGWQLIDGGMTAEPGGLVSGTARTTLLFEAVPALEAGAIEVRLVPRERRGQSNWAVAGVLLYQTDDRYWQLCLVQDPDRRTHRLELVENHDGRWQAQIEGATLLPKEEQGEATWRMGEPLRLRLEWDATGIRAAAFALEAAEPRWRVSFRWDQGQPAVRLGRPALRTDSLITEYSALKAAGPSPNRPTADGTALLLDGDGPWVDGAWRQAAAALAAMLTEAGYAFERVAPAAAAERLTEPEVALVAAPSLQRLPEPTMVAIADFVRRGGDILATGGEPFAEPLRQGADGGWRPRSDVLGELVRPRWLVRPAERRDLRRGAGGGGSDPVMRHGTVGPTGEPDALTVSIDKLAGWDVLTVPAFDQTPFIDGATLTVLSVRGTPGQSLSVEWKEADESRWIATVPLTAEWRTHVLAPSEFKYWPNVTPDTREQTKFRPDGARTLTFGPAMSHGARPGPVEYSIGPIGVAANPWPEPPFEAPLLEILSPWYKQSATTRDGRAARFAPARFRGLTMATEPDGRHAVVGELTSPAATRFASPDGSHRVWITSLPLRDDDRRRLVDDLRRGRVGAMLLNAGPTVFTLFAGEPLQVGARATNASALPVSAVARWSLLAGRDRAPVGEQPLALAPGGLRGVMSPPGEPLATGQYTVVTELLVGGQVVDELRSPLRVIDPAAPRLDGRRVSVVDGHFQARGRRVFLHGVNYWPRYITGQEYARYNSHWLTPRNYDPEMIEADLETMERLGLNLVSIIYTGGDQTRPMLDFVARCRAHGIWVNAYIGAANGEELERAVAAIESAGLANDDTIAMYDLLWEPRLGDETARRRLDPAWREWVAEQYGSPAAAEAQWGQAGPRDAAGELTGVPTAWLQTDGDYRRVVAAYRRFVDDHISRHYGRVARLLREVDPAALLSVRTGYGGTGHEFPNAVMAYDLLSGAAHLDLVSPEGYGLPPSFADGRHTGFITAYGRWAGAGKPVFWCEYGQSIGPRDGTAEVRELQLQIWDAMFQVIADSGADASAGWWWPGGWRRGEESDYGVLDPDGTPRASLVRAAEWGRRLNERPPAPRGEPVTILIDRDADTRGLHGLWLKHRDAYDAAREAGRPVRVMTAGTGTTTATMPRVQVGGTPHAGVGPLAHANAELTILPGDGATTVRVLAQNTGEATWLPRDAPAGGVALRVGDRLVPLTAEVARFGTLTFGPLRAAAGDPLRLEIAGVGPFGQRVTVPTGG